MTRRTLFLLLLLSALNLIHPFAAAQGTNPAAHPHFDGIWNSATATPLERPAALKDKAFYTPAEAAEWERQVAGRNQDPSPEAASKNVGTYNVFFRLHRPRSLCSSTFARRMASHSSGGH